jgi:hypothetical protein
MESKPLSVPTRSGIKIDLDTWIRGKDNPMNLANVTSKTLSQELGEEVPDVYVIVAKHKVQGLDDESIAEVIGCEPEDIKEVESDELYKRIRTAIGVMVAANHADQPMIWDSIESIAGTRLLERLQHSNDPEFLLKAAATANRMTRRQKNQDLVLDPSRGAGKTAVTLTSRMVQKITQAGHRTVVEERSLSIHDGSMTNPSFDEVNEMLAIRPHLTPSRLTIQQSNDSLHDLDE